MSQPPIPVPAPAALHAVPATPAVYIVEQDAFPNTVAEVPTAIPAFLGYTEKAADGPVSKAGIPTYIASMADYQQVFGGPPPSTFSLAPSAERKSHVATLEQKFFLYHGIRLYFLNGGGPAYVISVGTYSGVAANGVRLKDFVPPPDLAGLIEAPFDALEKVLDVTLIVAPDTTLLGNADDCYQFWQLALEHCGRMQSRMALIDIYDGGKQRTYDADNDVISGATAGFREKIGANFLNYGAAYYPWLNFDVVDEASITYDSFNDDGLGVLVTALNAELSALTPAPAMQATMAELYQRIAQRLPADASPLPAGAESRTATIARNHKQLKQVSPQYSRLVADMLALANQLPPGCAMAAVYARTDASHGVWGAPANTGIVGAVSPMVDISHDEQEDLNMPLDGRAVNALRTLPGRGLLVWGARTLDGNSDDWRYINVRRTLIMIEQSIKTALHPYVFAPNTAITWAAVQQVISNFLLNLWKSGGLVGTTPQDAFSVQIGLGSTMTGEDIGAGYMRVLVRVAVTRPAEFIELTFLQQQASASLS